MQAAYGEVTITASATTSVNVGFQPKKLAYSCVNSSSEMKRIIVYDSSVSTTKFMLAETFYPIGTSTSNNMSSCLYSIDSNGFTINKMSNSTYGPTVKWFAITY